jgi:hypothetical protein
MDIIWKMGVAEGGATLLKVPALRTRGILFQNKAVSTSLFACVVQIIIINIETDCL